LDDPAGHVSDPQSPKPAVAPPAPRSNGLLLALVLASLGVAVGAWYVSSRQIDRLEREVAALRDDQRQLAVEVFQGRKGAGGGPVGQVIDVSKSPARGRADAVVTLIEFSDYECPFCIRHFQQTMPRINENYIKSGKVRYVFRDSPSTRIIRRRSRRTKRRTARSISRSSGTCIRVSSARPARTRPPRSRT
jgi:protein-disulfide isomerase